MKPIAVSFGSLKKIAISIAVSFVLAAFFVPNLSLAATELPGAISSVTNAGHIIYQDSVLYKDNFGSPSDYWTFRFNWPNGVGNTRAFLGVARGTFGNGDAPALYDNYAFNYQSWPSGNNTLGKYISIPKFGTDTAESGTYTVILAEMSADYDGVGTAKWFFSGGASGSAPGNYSFLTFEYYQSPDELLDPVIVIPGILGSWEKNGELVIDPVLHTYDDLINIFVLNGFEEGKDIFPFPYDWRESNIYTAGLLRNKINEVQEICECDKVDIVAHSMGGLVVRYYIQSGLYENDVDQLIFLATPHLGSPKAYLAWEGGEFGFETRDNVLEFVLRVEGWKNGFRELFDYIRNNPISSVQQLLSTSNYIKDKTTDTYRAYSNGYPENQFIENLNDNVSGLLNSGVDISNFVGNTGPQSTIGALRVVPSINLPRWEHGYPENYFDGDTDRGLEYGVGDDTVTVSSASFIGSNILELSANHNSIVKESQAFVYEILVGDSPEIISDLMLSEDIYLLVQVLSPVDIQIIAPDGKRLGKNFETGEEINEIPGAFYSGFETDNEYITIPDPLDGEYKVLSKGTDGGGEYTLVTGLAYNGGLSQSENSGHILPGDFKQQSVMINTELPENFTITDTTEVTYAVLLDHISQAFELGWIVNEEYKNLLNTLVNNSSLMLERQKSKPERVLLLAVQIELENGLRSGKLTNDGYGLLTEDIEVMLR